MSTEFHMLAMLPPVNLAVAAFGVVILFAGLFGVARPASFTSRIERVWVSGAAPIAALLFRVALGLLLLIAAPDTRFPDTILVLGIVSLVSAVSILLLGHARMKNLIEWWCRHPDHFVRGWSLLVCAFGAFLICAAIPARAMPAVATTRSAGFLTAHNQSTNVFCAKVSKPNPAR